LTSDANFNAKLKIIDSYAFAWSKFTTVELPGTMTTINDYAFAFCSSLTTINIPGSLTTLQRCAFYGDSALGGDLYFPSGITEIGDNCYFGCTNVTAAYFSATTLHVGASCFQGDNKIYLIQIPGNGQMDDYCFYGCGTENVSGTRGSLRIKLTSGPTDYITWVYATGIWCLDYFKNGSHVYKARIFLEIYLNGSTVPMEHQVSDYDP
jgi:hypothetical protein